MNVRKIIKQITHKHAAHPPNNQICNSKRGRPVSFLNRQNVLPAQTDYLLSGGLNAENVGDAIRLANPPGLDISSGVERAPGVKDTALIEAFFRAARA